MEHHGGEDIAEQVGVAPISDAKRSTPNSSASPPTSTPPST
jgi:hypothetical protein